MNDNTEFPALDDFRAIEHALFSEDSALPYALAGFRDGLNQALDRIGFTGAYVETEVARLRGRGEGDEDIERQLGSD